MCQHYKTLWPRTHQFGVAFPFSSARCSDSRTILTGSAWVWGAVGSQRRDQGDVAAQCGAMFGMLGGPIYNSVQSAPVILAYASGGGAGKAMRPSPPSASLQTRTHACLIRGALRARWPERAQAALWSPYGSTSAPHPGLPLPPQRWSATREAQPPAKRGVEMLT